jgi:hypothetical protein
MNMLEEYRWRWKDGKYFVAGWEVGLMEWFRKVVR